MVSNLYYVVEMVVSPENVTEMVFLDEGNAMMCVAEYAEEGKKAGYTIEWCSKESFRALEDDYSLAWTVELLRLPSSDGLYETINH